MMPLQKVTDMTYDRSLLGMLVGYGSFTLESAGQDQALSHITHVPDADEHYRAICTQLFGPASREKATPGDRREPPGHDRPDDGPDGPGGPGPRGPSSPTAPASGSPRDGRIEPTAQPESWYRSSNLRRPLRLGDTGEIPVVRVPREHDLGDHDHRDAEGATLYPPRDWR